MKINHELLLDIDLESREFLSQIIQLLSPMSASHCMLMYLASIGGVSVEYIYYIVRPPLLKTTTTPLMRHSREINIID